MKNKMIEIERLFAACIILLYHLGVVKSGWIFVEFFFLLSGYFLCNHLETRKDIIAQSSSFYPLVYTYKKYLALFPYTAISIVVMWIFYVDAWNLSFSGILKWLLYLPCELLLMGGSGMLPYGYTFWGSIATPRLMNVLLWYVSSMLFVMPFVFYLLFHHKKFRSLLCSMIPAALYGILIMKDGTVNGWHNEKFGFIFCNIRAAAGLLLGAGVWHLSKWFQTPNFTKLAKWLLTGIEVMSIIFVAAVSTISKTPYDSLAILLFSISLALTFSGITYTASFKCRFADFLGPCSLTIYCLHKPIISYCSMYIGTQDPWIITLITIVISSFYAWLITNIRTRRKTHKSKIVSLLIHE